LTPYLFNIWEEWAQTYEDEKNSTDMILDKQNNTNIRPIGETISPNWMKYEFQNFEEFYQYYMQLLGIGD
jgi:hypothetical protein